jgi:hypothetical protein
MVGCTSSKKIEKEVSDEKLTNFNLTTLKLTKSQLKSGASTFSSEYQKIIASADEALNEGPFSVVHKTQVAISGNKHDYLSLAPYWWPDESKPDGMPWLRRDGEINPLTTGNNVDRPTLNKCFGNIRKLSLAYYFSDKEVYVRKLNDLLDTWFVNPDSRMNPNLNYAQGVPGSSEGRCYGIIEFRIVTDVISAIEFMELSTAIDQKLNDSLRAWLAEYLNWLQISELGIMEKTRKNNHATYYDVQVVSILLFLDREEEAKKVLEEAKIRISSQIEKDGSQPHEIARTKSLSYSTMNLRGFTQLAFYGKKVGVDLWNYKDENGVGIQTAYEFLYPYAVGEKEWTHKELSSLDEAVTKLQNLYTMAGAIFENSEYCDVKVDKSPSLFYQCSQ